MVSSIHILIVDHMSADISGLMTYLAKQLQLQKWRLQRSSLRYDLPDAELNQALGKSASWY